MKRKIDILCMGNMAATDVTCFADFLMNRCLKFFINVEETLMLPT
jgi:hypothetical protein